MILVNNIVNIKFLKRTTNVLNNFYYYQNKNKKSFPEIREAFLIYFN